LITPLDQDSFVLGRVPIWDSAAEKSSFGSRLQISDKLMENVL